MAAQVHGHGDQRRQLAALVRELGHRHGDPRQQVLARRPQRDAAPVVAHLGAAGLAGQPGGPEVARGGVSRAGAEHQVDIAEGGIGAQQGFAAQDAEQLLQQVQHAAAVEDGVQAAQDHQGAAVAAIRQQQFHGRAVLEAQGFRGNELAAAAGAGVPLAVLDHAHPRRQAVALPARLAALADQAQARAGVELGHALQGLAPVLRLQPALAGQHEYHVARAFQRPAAGADAGVVVLRRGQGPRDPRLRRQRRQGRRGLKPI
ncbi:hypothetical protein D0B54_11395 [Solimonas sp. K1W22B-7]|nr:hypothetical protein D0B54_11395 [Solimonas sp. K1W22B-7]